MDSDSNISKFQMGALVIWMLISQVLGLLLILVGLLPLMKYGWYFNVMAVLLIIINPVVLIGLGIASWIFIAKKRYKRSLVATSLIFIYTFLFSMIPGIFF